MKKYNLLGALSVISYASTVFAQHGVAAPSGVDGVRGTIAIAAAIAIGAAALGGTLGQGKVISAAMEGIARNPAAQGKMLIPMVLGLALIESLVVLAFVISMKLTP